ncbi:hypothetical protein GGI21_004806, partial [Coemansia aciculifera]
WLQMAEAARMRREELLRKWSEAMSFRNRRVLKRALGTWRKAADSKALAAGGSYEKVQMKLATMHCRNLYIRRAFEHLRDCWDLQQRLHCWEEEAPPKLVVACLIKWKDRLVQKQGSATRLAVDKAEQATTNNALRRTLRCWRQQASLRKREQFFLQWRRERTVRESVHVWRLQTVEKKYTERQQKHSPIKQSLVRWRDAAGSQRRERDCVIEKDSMLRKQLLGWRALTQQTRNQESQADVLRMRSLLYTSFDHLFDGIQARQTANDQALRFYRYQAMARSFEVWRQHCRARRDSQLQSRAIRDLTRRRDQKQRRLVLSAWREVAGRVNRAELYADELVSRRRRAMLVTCFRQWYGACTFVGITPHTGTIPRTIMAPPQEPKVPQVQQPQVESQPRYQPPPPMSAPVANAQTMTSMVEDVPTRGRATSFRTEPVLTRAELDERQELLRRVRVAEEEANRYKSLYVDPKKVKMDIVAHEERLDDLLVQW